ncbi:uncharacterized protein LOC110017880 [Phalaenopsis equestris]|uniref:uncharacterized protein LOC110017880 n=1 Tax=Phalaenopsis equestris TaxID=78828 RepID=UPI0009E4C57A|nr:uncharacterized protein LOC110017880 [Phalaenopsis equestris]
MKLLQELVPGCSKISGTALVLDEIINHVQLLQRQVEILSMRLAAVNPRVDFTGLDNLLSAEKKEYFGRMGKMRGNNARKEKGLTNGQLSLLHPEEGMTENCGRVNASGHAPGWVDGNGVMRRNQHYDDQQIWHVDLEQQEETEQLSHHRHHHHRVLISGSSSGSPPGTSLFGYDPSASGNPLFEFG